MIRPVCVALALASLSGCAATPSGSATAQASDPRQCFSSRNVSSYAQ